MPAPTFSETTTELPLPSLNKHIAKNAAWATSFEADHPGLFEKLSQGQQPQILWFGCSDSRVPESLVLDSKDPGEIFVHRNIANIFRKADDSCHSVLEYGVRHLGIKHVVVIGHNACGGCAAAFKSDPPASNEAEDSTFDRQCQRENIPSLRESDDKAIDANTSPLMKFLQPLIKLRHTLPEGSTLDDLIVANVKRGVDEICETEVIKKNWATAKERDDVPVQVHGWLYDLSTGRLSDLNLTRSA